MTGPRALAVACVMVWAGMAQAEPFRLIVTHLEPPLVPNAVMDLALELGYFAREGVEVELIRVQQTPSAMAALLSGSGDMANVGVDAVLQQHVQGNGALVAVASPNKYLPFLIAARAGIATPADLPGHSFGVGRIGSLDHALGVQVLAGAGVAMQDLAVVALGQPGVRAQALAAGRIDATTLSIGAWLSLPDKTGLGILIGPDTYAAAAPVVNKVNVMRRDVLAARRPEAEAVVRAITLASRDFAANPAAWADAMAPYAPQLTEAQLGELATGFAGSWSVNAGLGRAALRFTQDWLLDTEAFAGAAPVALDDWVDFSVADSVLTQIGVDPGSDPPDR